MSYWPDMAFDERLIEDIINDYAYLHSNQTIIWKCREFHYPEGLKDMLKREFDVVNNILWIRGCFMDWDIEIALAKTGSGEATIVDYVNTRRASGGLLTSALKKAVKEQLPEIANSGYVVALDISASGDELFFEDSNPTRVGYISDSLTYRINRTVEKILSLSEKNENHDTLVTLME